MTPGAAGVGRGPGGRGHGGDDVGGGCCADDHGGGVHHAQVERGDLLGEARVALPHRRRQREREHFRNKLR